MEDSGKPLESGDICVMCIQNKIMTSESHDHFFHKCPWVKVRRKRFAKELLRIINEKTGNNITIEEFPWWFSFEDANQLNTWQSGSVEWKLVQYQDSGNMCGFPKGLQIYLKKLGSNHYKSLAKKSFASKLKIY